MIIQNKFYYLQSFAMLWTIRQNARFCQIKTSLNQLVSQRCCSTNIHKWLPLMYGQYKQFYNFLTTNHSLKIFNQNIFFIFWLKDKFIDIKLKSLKYNFKQVYEIVCESTPFFVSNSKLVKKVPLPKVALVIDYEWLHCSVLPYINADGLSR